MAVVAPGAGSASQGTLPLPNLQSVLTRDQGDEYEQTLTWTPLTVVTTPTSIRTDRKIKWIDLRVRMRLTNGGTGPTLRTNSPVFAGVGANQTASVIFGLIQQVTVRGQHLTYGAQQPIIMRGEFLAELMAIYNPNYYPWWTVSQQAGAVVRFNSLDVTAAHTNDIEFMLPIPTFPYGLGPNDQVFYCLHGPDWPGNLYIDVQCNDGSAIATANPPTISAYGSGTGSGTIDVYTVRPLLGKSVMQWIRPSITFRVYASTQPTQAVQTGGGTAQLLDTLVVGKDTTRLGVKVGTLASGGSAGVTQYGSYLDTVITRTIFSLDARPLRFTVGAVGDTLTNDYFARLVGRISFAGFRFIDFIEQAFLEACNPKAAFGSSALTAARKFEVDADITAGASNICEVMQEMLLDAPAWQGPTITNG